MGRKACTEPQCLYKGALYLTFLFGDIVTFNITISCLDVVLVRRSTELLRLDKEAKTQADIVIMCIMFIRL